MSNRPEPQSHSQPESNSNSETNLPPHLDPSTYPRILTTTVPLTDPSTSTTSDSTQTTGSERTETQIPIHLELTYHPLNPSTALNFISSSSSGANILFLGTTRDTFNGRQVSQLSYTTYPSMALKSLRGIAEDAVRKYGLGGVYIAHRLGVVPVKEASIVVAVGSGHRGEGWKGAEGILEDVKERVEVWKREEFVDGGAEWRANQERDASGNLIGKKEG
ncbi:molybdopterin synthase catalytic subunit [Aspergillus stella-maris]|uniref:molybdopterin synthase catalytic subunit n=1 Tax=Aspergillus stella-maris TaxID=1810926 RepID=UPI003CCDDCF7